MVDENRFDEVNEPDELEQALAALAPRASSIDRDRLLFLAGQASSGAPRRSASFGRWAWPVATCVSTAAALVLAVMLFTQSRTIGDLTLQAKIEGAAQRELRPLDVANTAKQDVHSATENSIAQQEPRPRDVANSSESNLWPWSQLRLAPHHTPTADRLSDRSNYLELRSAVLAFGINAFPEPRTANGIPLATPGPDERKSRPELLEELLNSDTRRQDNRL